MCALFVGMLAVAPAHAHPSGHGGGHGMDPTPSPETGKPPSPPATYSGVVQALRQHHAAGATALDSNKVADLQRAVVRLGELADVVPQRTQSLSAEAKSEADAAAARIKVQVDVILDAVLGADKPKGLTAMDSLLGEINTLQRLAK